MPLILTSGPAAEPVTIAEAKTHLRVDGTAEDTLIASLVVTSRLHVEAAAGLALVTQSWSWYLDAWPAGRALQLPLRPIQSIAAVRLYDESGAATTLEPASYLLDGAGPHPRLVRLGTPVWPRPGRIANGIEVAFTAGYGNAAADVPAPIRQATGHYSPPHDLTTHQPATPRACTARAAAPAAAAACGPAPRDGWRRPSWSDTGEMVSGEMVSEGRAICTT